MWAFLAINGKRTCVASIVSAGDRDMFEFHLKNSTT